MAIQQALYRRYRSQTFAEMIGQKHIATALTNQIKNDTVSHAYIFNGTRGVGKTSAARIFARAVNCLDSVNGEPCGKCANCLEYFNGGNIDIVEIDAASNNGVDFARDLREKVAYAPVSSRYKVYIIDEAQMLTMPAFDTLLKTLEEPPEHVIFILCTTEIHKFPATILSRCMRFDFHLVSAEEITGHLCKIFDDLKVSYTVDAVREIASAGEGSVRDALTIADRCVALSGSKITYDVVLSVLGATSKDVLIDMANAIISNDADKILKITDKLVFEGKSIMVLARDLCKHFRELVIIKLCSGADKLLNLPSELYAKLQKTAEKADNSKLLYVVEQLSTLEPQLRESLAPQVLLEAVLLKLASSSGVLNTENLDMRITRLEKLIAGGIIQQNTKKKTNIEVKLAVPNAKAEEKATETISRPTVVKTDTPVKPSTTERVIKPTEPKTEPTKPTEQKLAPEVAEQLQKELPVIDDFDDEGVPEEVIKEKPAVKSTMTVTAVSIWSDLLAVARAEGENLLALTCSDIKDVSLRDKTLLVRCNIPQKQSLISKRHEELVKRVLGKYNLTLQVEDNAEAENADDDITSLLGTNLKI